jgi:hypothetical protein
VGTLHPDGANDEDDPVNASDQEGSAAVDNPVATDDLVAPRDEAAAALTEQRRSALAKARRNEPPPKESWRKRTATGAVLTGFALGFREALGSEPQKAAIIMEAPGDPPSDLPVDAEVDQIRPADNVVRIRPWLLPNGEGATDATPTEEDPDGVTTTDDVTTEDPDDDPATDGVATTDDVTNI